MLSRVRRYVPEPGLQAYRATRRAWYRLQEHVVDQDLPRPPRPAVDASAPARLLIGPANFAGQGWAWARAAEQFLTGVDATNMAVERDRLVFPADYVVPAVVYRSLRWADEQRAVLRDTYTHVLLEAMRPVLGNRYGEDCRRDLVTLRKDGLSVGLVAHGSDIRLGSLHAELYPYSPWKDSGWELGRRLQAQAERLSRLMADDPGPAFVSTPDLLDFCPRATWLPVVVDGTDWTSDRPLLEARRPVVLHVPSNPELKGSRHIDAQMQPLHDRGLIEYRRTEGVPPQQMPGLVADSDIVIDQVALGLYSAMAVQAMYAGRVAVAHVHERVRARVGRELPIVEATPDDLTDVVERLVAERDEAREVAARGTVYAREVHDGRRSAAALTTFLGASLKP